MRNLAHLSARLFNAPLMLLPDAANSLSSAFLELLHGNATTVVVGGQHGAIAPAPEPLAFSGNVAAPSRFADKPYTVTDQGIGLLSVTGPLVQRAGQITPDCMPLASYQKMQQRMDAMQADPDVKGILVEWDTPGGEVSGNFALAARWMAARGSKPVWSYVNELVASAGYSLAASTDRIVMPASGLSGSIGVVMMFLDQSERDKKQGLAYEFVYAGDRKIDFNSHATLSKEARARAEKMVLSTYDHLTAHVAASRSINQQAVRDTQAGVFDGPESKQLGLVDDIGSFDDTLAELTALVQRGPMFSATSGRMAAPITAKGGTMSQANQAATQPALSAAPPVGAAPAEPRDVDASATQAAVQAARTEGHSAGYSAGASAERTRISAILGHANAQGRQSLAHTLAFSTDMAPEAAATVMQSAAQEPVPGAKAVVISALSPLAAAMATVPNPKVVAALNEQSGGAEETSHSLAANVVSLHRQVKGA
jgi:capsid assembly protease